MKGHTVCLELLKDMYVHMYITSKCLTAARGGKHSMANALHIRNASCWDEMATHPDAKLHVLAAVDLHAFIQQANLLKVLPVDHKAANQSRAPENREERHTKKRC